MDTLKKILANTWAVVALILATIAALTVLLVTHTITVEQAEAALVAFAWAVGITWHRGAPSDKAPMVLLCASLILPATACSGLKPAAQVANDVARDLCALHYSEREQVSLEDAAKTFCQDLRPWLDLVLRAQREGTPQPEQCGDAGAP